MLVLSEFLCPSDAQPAINAKFGPTSYVASTGSGLEGGSPLETDGPFGINSKVRPAEFLGGLSKTALLSESPLGAPQSATHEVEREYKFVLAAPLAQSRCDSSTQWNLSDPRGFAWVSGEFRCALYNHKLAPNSAEADCIGVQFAGPPTTRYTSFGWRAAQHPPGGRPSGLRGWKRALHGERD